MPIDRTAHQVPFATPAGATAPIFLKWLLCWEDPIARTVWIGRAIPRVWLSEGETVAVDGATTAYGRLTFAITSTIDSANSIVANITVPAAWAHSAPPGGLSVRARAPGSKKLPSSVTIGGEKWAAVTGDSVSFTAADLAKGSVIAGLQHIKFAY